MSTTIKDLINEEYADIERAVEDGDVEFLKKKASEFKGRDEDEKAEHLLELANLAERGEWAYDEWKDNNLD